MKKIYHLVVLILAWNQFHKTLYPYDYIYVFDLYPPQYVPCVAESNLHPAVYQIFSLQKSEGIFIAAYFFSVRSLRLCTLIYM